MSGFSLLLPQHEEDRELTERWSAKGGEHYTHVRTLGAKAGLDDEAIIKLQDAYAQAYPEFGVYLSKPGQVEGFRRIIKFDPGWLGEHEDFRRSAVLAVDDRGRLHGRVLQFGGGTGDRTNPSVVDVLRNGDPWGGALGQPAVLDDLNRFASAYKKRPLAVAQDFYFRVKHGAGLEEKLPGPFTNPLKAFMRRWITSSHRLAAWAIFDALDPEISRQMRSTHATTLEHAFWFSGTDQPTTPDEAERLARNRLQASKVYPFMTLHFQRKDFAAAIDAGAPLAPMIETEFGLSRHEAKALQGVSWQKLGMGIRPGFEEVAIAARIGSRFGGITRKNYPYLHSTWRAARRLGVSEGEFLDKVAPAFKNGPEEGWTRARRLQDTADMADYLVWKLYVPAALHGLRQHLSANTATAPVKGARQLHVEMEPDYRAVGKKALPEIFRGLSLKDLLAASDRWHRSLPAHNLRTSTLETGVIWTPMLGSHEAKGGVLCRELASSSSLAEQGQAEGHCVGGYDRNVLHSSDRRLTLIFSLETPEGVIGTLEVFGTKARSEEGAPEHYAFGIAQLRSKQNSKVGPEAEAAAAELVSHLGKMPVEDYADYLAGLTDAQSRRKGQAQLSHTLSEARFNVWDRGELEAAWSDLSVYLPRSVRKAGLETFIAESMAKLMENGDAMLGSYAPQSCTDIMRLEGSVFEGNDGDGDPVLYQIRPFWEIQEMQVKAIRGEADMPDTVAWSALMQLRAPHPETAPQAQAEEAEHDDDFAEIPF